MGATAPPPAPLLCTALEIQAKVYCLYKKTGQLLCLWLAIVGYQWTGPLDGKLWNCIVWTVMSDFVKLHHKYLQLGAVYFSWGRGGADGIWRSVIWKLYDLPNFWFFRMPPLIRVSFWKAPPWIKNTYGIKKVTTLKFRFVTFLVIYWKKPES